MSRVAVCALGLWLGGCADPVDGSSCEPDPRGLLVVASTDFTVGAIGTVGLDDGRVDDAVALAGGDPLVDVLADGRVALLERGGADHLRLYTPGCWSGPDVEVALGAANPHDLVEADGALWLTAYDEPALQLRDPFDGAWLAEVDLSAEADADGLPEADRLVVDDGLVWVALQRLDRGDGWTSAGGRLVAVDPVGRGVVDAVEVGPSPRLFASERGLVVLTGLWFALDGAVTLVDPTTGVTSELATEAELGLDVSHYAEVGDVGVFVGVDLDGRSHVRCLDWPTGEWTQGPSSDAWYADAVATPDGHVVLASRSGFVQPTAGDGLVTVDPAACDVSVAVPLLLEPYALTVRPATP